MDIFKWFRKAPKKQISVDNIAVDAESHRPMPTPPLPRPFLAAYPTKTLRANDTLLEAQPVLSSLYLLTNGSIELSLSTPEATSRVVLQKGDVFGFLSHPDDGTSYSMKSLSSSSLIQIDSHKFSALSDSDKLFLYDQSHKTFSKLLSEYSKSISYYHHQNNDLLLYILNFEEKRKAAIDSKIIQDAINHIPKLPAYAGDLLLNCLDDNVSINHITEKVQNDPSLAGLILKNVNSSYYGLRRKISSLPHAIAYLGMNNIYQIILNEVVKNILPNNNSLKDIQIHSNFISIIAHVISGLCKKSKATNPMTIGILHDIGKIVVLLLKRKFPHMNSLLNTVDDAILGARLLKQWELPESIFFVVENQNLPQFCPPEKLDEQYRDDIIILYLAHVYYDMLMEQQQYATTYIDQYIETLHSPYKNYGQMYQEGLIPALRRNKQRFPESLWPMLAPRLQAE
jgi:HD-like signal output (HDOD) protein